MVPFSRLDNESLWVEGSFLTLAASAVIIPEACTYALPTAGTAKDKSIANAMPDTIPKIFLLHVLFICASSLLHFQSPSFNVTSLFAAEPLFPFVLRFLIIAIASHMIGRTLLFLQFPMICHFTGRA